MFTHTHTHTHTRTPRVGACGVCVGTLCLPAGVFAFRREVHKRGRCRRCSERAGNPGRMMEPQMPSALDHWALSHGGEDGRSPVYMWVVSVGVLYVWVFVC